METHNCKRCGLCCMTVGSTFWIHGDFEKWPDLQKRKDQARLCGDNAMPCQMLEVSGGATLCRIHRDYGIEAKPEVCRDHPEDELCQHEKLFE